MAGQAETADDRSAAAERPYDPPTIIRLGTLHELTLGAFGGTADGIGGFAGDEGSLPIG
jgi:hypothetical protein